MESILPYGKINFIQISTENYRGGRGGEGGLLFPTTFSYMCVHVYVCIFF